MSKALCAALLCTSFLSLQAQAPKASAPKAEPAPAATLTIHPDQPLHPVSPMLYGMMTEEINHAFDGGLYPELINNRAFRWAWRGPEHWNLALHGDAAATITQDKSTGPSRALPTSAELTITSASSGNEAGLSNTGYWGIAVHPRTMYKGSFYAKVDDAAIGPITASLICDTTGATLASAEIPTHPGDWQQYAFTLTTKIVAPSTANHLSLTVAHPGHLWLQLVSLMPPTFNDRPNGFRPDLMQKMAGLHPHFLRLPGGNYLEGDTLADWYNWRETVGPLVARPGHQAPWTYWSSDGLGLLDFLNWCEDLRIEPVLAVYAGYSLKQQHITPGRDLEPYVQSALDEVEYVTGDASTKWGARRAADGHPAPFPLHYIEIGNEDEFDKSHSYDARFQQFALALRKKYPQYKLIATTPVKVSAEAQPDVIDDHYYKTPDGMMALSDHYDNAPRTGPKIFVGEWATQSGDPTPDFGAALADAAFMTGLERNSDLIVMASYAPLFTNINPGAIQWHPDLIGYDGLKSYASPSYYAQSLFAGHLGDTVPATTLTGQSPRFFQSTTLDAKTHKLYLKLVNASTDPQALTITIAGLTQSTTATVNSLHASTYEATDTMADPSLITPRNSLTRVPTGDWHYTVPPLTLQVIDIPLR